MMRANLAIAEGRTVDAWADILAAHRLGALMGQDPILISRLVGVSLSGLASDTTVRLAEHGNVTAGQARKVLADMQALSPVPSMASAIQQSERYTFLDTIQYVSRCSPEELQEFLGMFDQSSGQAEAMVLVSGVDFNDVLRRANGYYDALAAALLMPDQVARKAKLDALLEQLIRIKVRSSQLPTGSAATEAGRTKTEWFGDVALSVFIPALARAETMADQAAVKRDLAMLAVALAGYKAEQGSYPDSLAALSPGWLTAIPQDRFSGKPLIYSKTADGYVLYSVGDNLTDDGGKGDPTDFQAEDIVVRMPAK
jgi:hypothetical protein